MPTATELEFAEVEVAPALAVQLPGQCACDAASIAAAMRTAFGSLLSFVTRHGLAINGRCRAIYKGYTATGVCFVVAAPVTAAPATSVDEPPIHVDMLPAAKAYRFTHHGPYSNLAQTYSLITAFLKEKGWIQSEVDWMRFMPMWEEYANDPEKTPASELLTYIYLPAV